MKNDGRRLLILTLLALMLAVVGCSNVGYQNGVVSVDVKLGVDALNQIVSNIGGEDSHFIGKIEKIELIEPNQMRITGDFKLESGDVQPGVIVFEFSSHDGKLGVQVVSMDVSGLSLDSGIIQSFNNALGNALGNEAADQSQSKGGISDVQVKDGKLVITVAIKLK